MLALLTMLPFAINDVVLAGQKNGFVGDFRGSEWAGATFTPVGERRALNRDPSGGRPRKVATAPLPLPKS